MTNILTNRAFQVAAAIGLVVLAGFTYQSLNTDTETNTTANNEQTTTANTEATEVSNEKQKSEVESADAAIMNGENVETTSN